MASPIITPAPWAYGQRPWTYSKQPAPARIHGLARFAFWTVLLLSLTNVIGVIIGVMRRLHDETYELSIYPVIFGVCLAIVLVFSKGRLRSTLLVVAWVFWLIYFLGGFLGSMQITGIDIRHTLRLTLKPWMGIVGLPWLALRAISEDKVPRLIHVTVVVTCLGALVGLLQITVPGFMDKLIANVGRAEGLWSNPTTSGFICAMVLFLTIVCPFRSRLLNWSSRLVLLAGVGASLSRGAILALVVAWAVYAVTARRFATLAKSALGLVFFVAATLAVIGTIEAFSEFQEERVAAIRSLLSGEWEVETFKDRTELWRPALDAILSKGGLLFGLGHGSMSRIVDTSVGGLQPHNYYLYVLGNSGLLALFGLLAFHFFLFQQALKCPERERRAALFAIATYWAIAHLVDDSLIGHPTASAVFACIVVTVAYARPRQRITRPRSQRPSYNGPVRLRPL